MIRIRILFLNIIRGLKRKEVLIDAGILVVMAAATAMIIGLDTGAEDPSAPTFSIQSVLIFLLLMQILLRGHDRFKAKAFATTLGIITWVYGGFFSLIIVVLVLTACAVVDAGGRYLYS